MAPPAGLTVVALPGFTRQPRHLERLAGACVAQGWSCVRPALAPAWMPALYMSRRRLDSVASRLALRLGTGPVVIAGHSAGGAAGTYLALALQRQGCDVRGLVLIDAVDSPNRLIASTLPALPESSGLRIAAVLAPPSRCNRQGALGEWLSAFPQVRVEWVEGAGHGDIEGPGVALYRRACGPAGSADTSDRVLAAVLDAISWASGAEAGG